MSASSNPSAQHRLRGCQVDHELQIVLVEPEIPPNTGNIARLCAATGCRLHLVHPLGFSIDAKAVRRAGLDYWHLVEVIEHPSFASFEAQLRSSDRLLFFSGKASKSFYEQSYRRGDHLVFGKESTGLSSATIEKYSEQLVGIPTLGAVRSLNLANSVALGAYEALRQLDAFATTELHALEEPSPHASR